MIGSNSSYVKEAIEGASLCFSDEIYVSVYCMGNSDCGVPIFLCVLNGAGDSSATFEKARSGTTILINNAIHPGEPDGVNACPI